MQANHICKLIAVIFTTSLLCACIGSSQSLTEEEKENLALLNQVNNPDRAKKDLNRDKNKTVKVSLLDAHQVEEKSPMVFKLVLNKAASQDISVSINLDTSFTHKDAQAKENVDFRLPNLTAVTIPAGKTETQFAVEIIDDNLIEATEQFKLMVSNLNIKDGSAEIYKKSAAGTILDNEVWRGPLNDTGIGFGANVNTGNTTCTAGTEFKAQDCSHGFDADPNENKNEDGRLGFSFTKLDAAGGVLGPDAENWSCVKDNRTGLIWEVKTATAKSTKPPYIHNPKYLHDKRWYYSSFDLRYLDGEYEGKKLSDYGVRREDLTQEQLYGKDNVFAGDIDIPVYNNGSGLQSSGSNACTNKRWVCTTHQYTLDVNQGNGLCGFRDWRIPTAIEAETIVDYSGKGMDANFFPNDVSFWTKTPFMDNNKIQYPSKTAIRYSYQKDRKYYFDRSSRSNDTSIRLVRSQQTDSYAPASHDYGDMPKPANPHQTYNKAIPASTPSSDFEFIPNTHGVLDTVKHLPTGLIWKRCPEKFKLNNKNTEIPEDDTCDYKGSAAKYISPNWQGILANVPAGWRVPNIKELKSLIEFNKSRPSINLVVFPSHLSTYCNNVRFSMEAHISLYSSSPSKKKAEFPAKPGEPFETKNVVHAYSFMTRYSRLNKYDKLVLNSYDFSHCSFTRLVKDK